MPDVKNCLSCRWEPKWERDAHHTTSGWCKFEVIAPVGANIDTPRFIKRKTGHIEIRYSDSEIYPWQDCPAYQPKEQTEDEPGNTRACPAFGCPEDCLATHTCQHHADCSDSADDTRENYCGTCGRLNDECECKPKEQTP